MSGSSRIAYGAGLRLAAALLFAAFSLSPLTALAQESKTTLKVAFPIQAGITEWDDNGEPTGYTYEYLQEVAQYTGWNYEFITPEGDINESLLASMEMLKRGELDLVGCLVYDKELAKTFDYAAYSYGNAYTVLAVQDEDRTFNEGNLPQVQTLRVAVPSSAKVRLEELRQFCAMNKITLETRPCDTIEDQLDMLRSGEADAILGVDLSLPKGLRTIARFAPRPFYLATTKGNADIVGKLNGTIMGINESDPYFTVGLYEKYFGTPSPTLYFTAEERTYIRGAGDIRVAVVPDRMPVQDVNRDTGEVIGVSREVFDYISQVTGLTFQFVPLDSINELPIVLENRTVDLVSGLPYDYKAAAGYGVAMSRPYLTGQTTIALSKNMDISDLSGKRLALSKGCVYDGRLTDNVTLYDTAEECLVAVNRGEADFAYNNSYVMQNYASRGRYKNVTLVPQAGETQKLCIGISKPANVTLLTILNRAIRSIPEENLQAMIYRNASPAVKVTFAGFVTDNPWLMVGAILVTALLLIGLLATYFHIHIRNARRGTLESERYKLLGELSNEHIFEYDFKRDRITLSEKSAQSLGVDQVRDNYRFRLQQDKSLAGKSEREFFDRILRERSGTVDMQVALPKGNPRWFRITVKMICDQTGKPIISVGRLTDIQCEREELERLADRARRDSLTAVLNAETTRQTVTRRMEEHPGAGGALLILDVDEFKNINDRHGHFVGDQVLITLAELLEETFRRSDVVGRLGGDEFVIFMDKVIDRVVVEDKCRRVMDGVAALKAPLDQLCITVSIGGTMADGKMDYNELYQLADKALYMVKGNNRNGYKLL